jgi:hypothetical protein
MTYVLLLMSVCFASPSVMLDSLSKDYHTTPIALGIGNLSHFLYFLRDRHGTAFVFLLRGTIRYVECQVGEGWRQKGLSAWTVRSRHSSRPIFSRSLTRKNLKILCDISAPLEVQ